MNALLAILIGILVGSGVYCLLRRDIFRLLIGLILLSQAVNLLVLSAAGLQPAPPALIAEDAVVLEHPVVDPLPQALVLTAIVIGFGLIGFTVILVHRTYRELGHGDIQNLGGAEQ